LLPTLLTALLKAWQELAGSARLRLPAARLLLGSRRRHGKPGGAACHDRYQHCPAAHHCGACSLNEH
jgi:hypothetical protein